MKTCGLIGGMSWESSSEYYKIMNEEVNKRLGGLHSAKVVLYSVDFEEIAKLQKENNWKKSGAILADVAKKLELAGCDFVMITTNTMHKVADIVKKSVDIPLIDIRDSVLKAIKKEKVKKVLLLGTKFTMEDDFYKNNLQKEVEVIIPNKNDREFIHKVIFKELCVGIVKEDSKRAFVEIINRYDSEGVILGCTEIGMLINGKDVNKKVFDSTIIHALDGVDLMLEE